MTMSIKIGISVLTCKAFATPPYIYDAASLNLFARLLAKGETPNAARKLAMDVAIKALKAASLFNTQWDVLVVTRGTGAFTTKENWIKDSSHALGVNAPNYVADVGYNTDGATSYLSSEYTPNTDGVLCTLNNASFGFKVSGTIGVGLQGHGAVSNVGQDNIYVVQAQSTCNSAVAGAGYSVGYLCVSRSAAANYSTHVNAGTTLNVSISTGLPIIKMGLLCITVNATTNYYVPVTEILECYYIGKSLSQANFLIFQGIMNTYFSSL